MMAECKDCFNSENIQKHDVDGSVIFLINAPSKPSCAHKASGFIISLIDLDFLNNNQINIIL
jgi:hypothetical protein